MEHFFENPKLSVTWTYIFTLFLLRYLIIAGFAYLYLWKWKAGHYKKWLIQEKFPPAGHLKRDFMFSLITLAVFATVGTALSRANAAGYTQIYYDIRQYGWGYFFISIILILVLHDTFFYWAHRFMHLPGVYQRVHLVHHLSTNPSPWTAFAFHPAEGLIEVMILPLVVFLFPTHIFAIVIFLIIMTIMSVIGHLGFETYPAGFVSHPVGKWNNTATHHNMHHKLVHCNYGLYFNWWDQVMKTNHPDYIKTFNAIKNRQ